MLSFDEIAIDVSHVTLNTEHFSVHLYYEWVLVEVLEASLVQVLHSGCHSRELLSGRVRVEHVPF